MADEESESDDEVEYSGMIQPPLIHQLRNILAEYPDDGQILKELIQNAEDAGASKMQILFDDRPVIAETNINEKKTPFRKYFKGPSLIVYNNAQFSEEDWKGIKMLYSSIKEFDPTKVGRFGLGFKSVFHITDHPIIVSGSQLLILDPHKDSSKVCQTMQLKKLQKYRKMKEEDCLAAFDGVFGFDRETLRTGTFEGTIFRFPLRQDSTELSNNIYDKEKVMDLFHSFKDEASVTLLFLKSLERIDLYLNGETSCHETLDLNSYFSVGISEESLSNVQCFRHEFMEAIKTLNGQLPSETLENKYQMGIHTEDEKGNTDNQVWLVVNCLKGGDMSKELRMLSKDDSLSYSPYVGVAVPIENDPNFQGHVFCFLPLPLEEKSLTGFPVHVNGFFALSQNRRHVKWASADQIRHGTHKDTAIRWNNCLITEVLAPAYYSLLTYIIETCKSEGNPDHLMNLVMQCIPSPEAVDNHWKILLQPLYRSLEYLPFLYTKNAGGKWIRVDEAIFANSLSDDPSVQSLSSTVKAIVLNVMEKYGMDIVDVPNNVWQMIQENFSHVETITPKFLSRCLKSKNIYTQCTAEEKENLLRYLLHGRNYSLLVGLELVPLYDGTFTTFNQRSTHSSVVYLCSEHQRKMFPGLDDLLVKTLPEDLLRYFKDIVGKNLFTISQPSSSDHVLLLKMAIDRNFGNKSSPKVWNKDGSAVKSDWLETVWEYLRKEMTYTLNAVKDLHIVPMYDGNKTSLYRLTDILIMKKNTRSTLSEKVCRCLEVMSVIVLPTLPEFILAHSQVQHFVNEPNCEGVIQILSEIKSMGTLSTLVQSFNDCCSADEKDAFVDLLSNIPRVPTEVTMILNAMKMFHGNDSDQMFCVNQRQQMIAKELVVRFCDPVILCVKAHHQRLAEILGVTKLSEDKIVKRILHTLVKRDFYSTEEKQTFITYFMKNIGLHEKNNEIMELVNEVTFVPDGNGVLKRPKDLYDSRDKTLYDLIENPSCFPLKKKVKNADLELLTKVGLKTGKDLTPNEILNIAQELDEKSRENSESEKQKSRSNLLLSVLTKNVHLFEMDVCGYSLRNKLSDLQIITPTDPPKSYGNILPWFKPKSQLCCPKDMMRQKFINLIGSVQPVLSADITNELIKGFHWNKKPHEDMVIKQLEIVVKNYDAKHRPKFSKCAMDIYEFLTEKRSENIYSQMRDKQCIWMGNGFCEPSKIYIQENQKDISLKPYMHALLPELRQNMAFNSLAKNVGCENKQSTSTLLMVQEMIKEKHDNEEQTATEVRHDLTLMINILNRLKIEKVLEEDVLFPIHSPDEKRLKIRKASECKFCNAEWLKDLAVDDGEELVFVHSEIPLETAELLGVPSLTDSLLEDTVGFEPWGQTEPLTRRIRNLIKDYKDGFSIPKEVVQNADDAGANRVCFLFDERENTECQSRLIDKGMKECHGPAIWAYNDAEFSEDDLKNITKLSGATKSEDTTKIGKFGLGFCSVYNMTDVPSFLTRQNMVIFDPHTKYLGKSIKQNNPGLMIDLSLKRNKTLLHRMKDQFQPFHGVFGCDLHALENDGYFKGTLFRFPLRTEQQAHQSEISNKVYSRREVNDLIKLFMENAGNLLLFTQNIHSIEFYHVSKEMSDPSNPKLIYKVSRSIMMCPIDGNHLNKTLETGCVSVLKDVSQEMQKVKQRQEKTISNISRAYMIEIEVEVNEHAGEFCRHPGKSSKSQWITVWSLGTDTSLKLANQTSLKGVLPLASVAILTESDGKERYVKQLKTAPYGFYTESHIFCYLPLPICTPLPVHINGSFAVTPDRRQLCFQTCDDKVTFESRWNTALMEDSVTNAYLLLLSSFPDLKLCYKKCYSEIWPMSRETQENQGNVYKLFSSFFRCIIKRQPKVFVHDSDWVAFSSCMFIEPILFESEIGPLVFKAAVHFLETRDIKVMEISRDVLKCFEDLEYKHHMRERIMTIDKFYSEIFFSNIYDEFWTEKTRNDIVLYALDHYHQTKIVKGLLMSHKCIPTYPNGVLVMPGDLIHPYGQLAKMFRPDDGKFVKSTKGEQFLTDERIRSLLSLGMMSDVFSKDNEYLLAVQAKSVQNLAEKCHVCALDRSFYILDYLDKNISCLVNDAVLKELQHCKFLPILERPDNWSFSWKADEIDSIKTDHDCPEQHQCSEKTLKLDCPDKLFHFSRINIVACTEVLIDLHFSKSRFAYKNKTLVSLGVKGVSEETVPVQTAVRQLCCLCDDDNLDELNEESKKRLNTACQDIYHFLERCLKAEGDENQMNILSDELDVLKRKQCLLINDRFIKPDCVAVSCRINCSPLLFSLYNNSLRHHIKLLKYLRIKETFEVDYIVNVLSQLSRENDGKKLSEDHLVPFCNLIHLLAETMVNPEQLHHKDIQLPDMDCKLTPIQDLCIEDVKYIKKSKSMKFVHERISNRDAKVIGVKSIARGKLLDHSQHFKPFGQKEELTSRIKRILSGYPCDEGILKEILQNADDSKATEVKFIIDESHHPTDKVFDDCWKPLQGPALLVWNNSSFTEDDIKGIQQLGVGSKSDDPTKTGQYGVGFNAVYHLTDVPSFLTKGPDIDGETLCVMDPLCKYVPEATIDSPGMQYLDLPELRNSFPDVFSCYFEEELLKNEGTIFRLPLRTAQFVSQSELSKSEINTDDMKQLMTKFQNEMLEMLVFVHNVKKITVSHISGGKVIDDYSVEVLISEEDDIKRRNFDHTIKDKFMNNVDKYSLLRLPAHEISYKIEINDSKGKVQKWLVVQRIGVNNEKVSDVLIQALQEGHIGLLPIGGVAMPLEQPASQKVTDKSKYRAYCFLPLPIHTGMPMHINGHFVLDHEARRNLWTEDKLGYRTDWNQLLLRMVICPAYISALHELKDILTLKNATDMLQKDVQANLQVFHKFFPLYSCATDQNWEYLVQSVYSHMMEQEKPLFVSCKLDIKGNYDVSFFPLKEKDCTFSAVFNTLQKQLEKGANSSTESAVLTKIIKDLGKQLKKGANSSTEFAVLTKILKDLGMKLLDTPDTICSSMTAAGIEPESISPEYLVNFLKSFRLKDQDSCALIGIDEGVANTSFQEIERVEVTLKYCMKSSEFSEEMNNLPLCVTNDRKLKCFSTQSPVFATKHCKLLPTSAAEFLHEQFVDILSGIDTKCFKSFDIPALANLLYFELPTEKFRVPKPVQWNSKSTEIPNGQWLKGIWKFIKEYRSKIKDQQHDNRWLDTCLLPLQNWCLIPCTTETKYFVNNVEQWLFPLHHAKKILLIESFSKEMKHALKSLKLPVLDDSVLPPGNRLLQLVATKDKPEYVLECLYQHRHEIAAFENLDKTVCDVILEWLANNVDIILKNTDNKQNCIDCLRALPLYWTIYGSNTDLPTNIKVLVLPSAMPTSGIQEYAQNTGQILLDLNSRLVKIYEVINIYESTVHDVYVNNIFPQYQCLPQETRLDHLEFIRDELLKRSQCYDTQQKKLIHALTRLSFVETTKGMKSATFFFSPFNEIMKTFGKDEEFPPEPFCSQTWKHFMELAGMKTKVTDEIFIRFANQLADLGKIECSNDIQKKSRLLVKQLFLQENIELNGLLGRVASIKFVAPYEVDKWLSSIHEQYEAGQMICFRNSVCSSNAAIAYTSCNLLPYWAVPKSTKQKDQLGVQVHPPLDKVIQHVQNIVDRLSNCDEGAIDRFGLSKLEDVMEEIYSHLQDNALQHSSLQILAAKPVLFVQRHKRFVPCRMAVIGSVKEIKPFLFPAPEEFGKFFPLFEKLGTQRGATCNTYANVLKSLHDYIFVKHNKEEEMHPNELKIVKEALNCFFKTLPETEKEIQKVLTVDILYLPSRQSHLVDASKLVYSMSPSTEEKLKDFEDIVYCIDMNKMEIKHSMKQLVNLPEKYRPQILFSMITRVFDHDEIISSDDVETVQSFIQSIHFVNGLKRVIVDGKHSLADGEEKEIETRLKKIQIKQVRKLKLIRMFRGRKIDTKSTLCHYDMENCDSDDAEYVFYCTLKGKGNLTERFTLIGNDFKSFLELCIGHEVSGSHLTSIFLCVEDPDSISEVLDEANVRPYKSNKKCVENIFPTPGTFVHQKWHVLLDNLYPDFDNGEYAALLLSDADVDRVFIYVIVQEKVTNSQEAYDEAIHMYTQEYKVKVSPSKSEVKKGYDLYKFTRETIIPSRELVLADPSSQHVHDHTNVGATNEHTTESSDSRTLSEILKEVKQVILSAWKLSEDERKKIIKRLLRKWHPDKNYGNEEKATEVFKYIKNIINKMENGLSVDDDSPRPPQPTPPTWSDFYEDINRNYNRERKRHDDYFKGQSRSQSNYRHNRYEANPQVCVARKWYKQAKSDLAFATEAFDAAKTVNGFNWICFCCYQATEKALKSVQYNTDAKKVSKSENIHDNLPNIENIRLRDLALSLEGLLGERRNMLYPDICLASKTPSDAYSMAKAETAIAKTRDILDIVQRELMD